jgi:fibronectin-binding autotransporter adhesin
MIGAANVEPASISITSDSLDYTIDSSGGGKITSGSISKSGTSVLTLAIANTFSAGTTLNAGRLRLGADGAAGTGLLTINGGRLSSVGSTARLIANNVLFANDVTIGDATDNGILTLSGILDLNGVSRTLTLDSDIIVSGSLSNGSLTKAGNGTLTMSNASTLTNTTISAGTVVATNASALGTTGTVTLNDAATGSANASLLIGNFSLGRAITVANQGSGTVTLGANGAVALPTFTGVITLAKDVTLNGGSNTDRLTFTGGIGGTGNVTVAGTGRVVFTTAANGFNGNLTVNSGSILQLSDGTGTATSFIPDAGLLTVNGTLKLAKGANSETVGGLAGSGEVRGHEGVASTASSLAINTSGDYTFSGVLSNGGAAGSTLSLSKSGIGTQNLTGSNATIYTGTTTVTDGTLSFANAAVLTGNTTVNGGRLVFNGNSSIGSGLISSGAAGEVSFGSNTLTIGNATASNQFYYGKLTGTGTLQLRGGSLTIQNADGTTAGTGSNFAIWQATTSVIQSKANQFFALDTGSSLTNRKDFGFINDTGDILNLSALSGYGAIRNDAGGASVRTLVVDQSTDTVFNGALLSHRSGGSAQRAVSLTKQGNGTLELAGFVGKSTASSTAGTAGGVALTVEGGVLNVTNAYNTTTTNADAIGLGLVTVTGGTLGFSNQALLNTAGSAGATRIDLNGGILRWNTGNTQDLSAGGRLKINDGVIGQLNTNANDVTLATAFALGASGTAGLTKLGNGTLTLSATNTYSGVTTVSSGTLAAGNSGAFGSSALAVSGGTLNLGGYAVNNTITLNSGSITGGTSFTGSILLNAVTLTLGSANDYGTGSITVGTGSTLDLNSWNPTNSINLAGGQLSNNGNWNGTVVLSGSANSTLINTLTLNTVRVVAGSTVDLAGVSKGITFEGGTLSNLSTYTGTLTVKTELNLTAASTGGALRLETGGSINYGSRASTDAIQYVGGGLTNASNYTGNLNVVGTGLALAAGNLGAGKVVVGTGTSVSIGAAFSNAIRLDGGSIVGSTLNNYQGTVTVASGQTLDLDGAGNVTDIIATADIVLESASILKGNATVGDITVQTGGILAPGNSPGTITASSLTLNSGGVMNFEVAAVTDLFGDPVITAGTDYDTVNVTGLLDLSALSFESRFNINLLSLGATATSAATGWDSNSAVSFILFDYGSLTLAANESITSIFSINTDGFYDTTGTKVLENHFSISNDIENARIMLNYSAVPEPSTYGIILGGLALAAAAIRRRKQMKA